MKFINYLETISGIEIYPMISLGIFFIFFIALTVWALTVSKNHIMEMKNLPFDKK
jgi:cbb3-type cytochrome oxidase subunit 3